MAGQAGDDPEDLVQCPYDNTHMVRHKRIAYHLLNHRESLSRQGVPQLMAFCPFNAKHVVPKVELQYHMLNCGDKGIMMSNVLYSQVEDAPSEPAPQCRYVYKEEENWDKDPSHTTFNLIASGGVNAYTKPGGGGGMAPPCDSLRQPREAPEVLRYEGLQLPVGMSASQAGSGRSLKEEPQSKAGYGRGLNKPRSGQQTTPGPASRAELATGADPGCSRSESRSSLSSQSMRRYATETPAFTLAHLRPRRDQGMGKGMGRAVGGAMGGAMDGAVGGMPVVDGGMIVVGGGMIGVGGAMAGVSGGAVGGMTGLGRGLPGAGRGVGRGVPPSQPGALGLSSPGRFPPGLPVAGYPPSGMSTPGPVQLTSELSTLGLGASGMSSPGQTGSDDENEDPTKMKRRLEKKLKQIEKLKAEQNSGKCLDPQQLEKVASKAIVVRQLKELHLSPE